MSAQRSNSGAGFQANYFGADLKSGGSYPSSFPRLIPREVAYEFGQDDVRADHGVCAMDELWPDGGTIRRRFGCETPELHLFDFNRTLLLCSLF
jgi:hypothetical protein